jgi:hypothetical protein
MGKVRMRYKYQSPKRTLFVEDLWKNIEPKATIVTRHILLDQLYHVRRGSSPSSETAKNKKEK